MPLLVLPIVLVSGPRAAEACGGLFCNGAQPVVQTGEGIIFVVDDAEETVEATINIQYEGEASEFAWLLPLQSAPLSVDLGHASVFNVGDLLTAPRFTLRSGGREGLCTERDNALYNEVGGAFSYGQPGVYVIDRAMTGPYEQVVLSGSDPEAVRAWLTDHGYAVTDEMMEVVVPYIAQGDVLLALRLQNGAGTQEIQPITVKMAGDEICVPIRLTAIAALEDMAITVYVLSNQGRAIPENYFHVTLNPARINWFRGGTNYTSLVAEAADEGGGHAFVTEYAGSTEPFRGMLVRRYELSRIATASTVLELLDALYKLDIFEPALVGIIRRHVPEGWPGNGRTIADVVRCPPCGELPPDSPVDGESVVEEFDELIVQPQKRMQDAFDRFRYVTRLYTLISPEEMTIDPLFAFRSDLPEVSNVHRATRINQCGVGGDGNRPARIDIEETGQSLWFHDLDRSILDSMPAALRVEQLYEDRVVTDNSALIAELIDEHNDQQRGCGCNAAKGQTGAWGAALLLVLLLRRRDS